MTANPVQVDRPGRKELGRLLIETQALSSDWAPVFAAVDRALFLPELMWPFDVEQQTSVPVNRSADADGWYKAADMNVPIVTQWDDGQHTGTSPGKVSTSSSSAPSVVYGLLKDMDIDEGQTALDVGTGPGETAGLLAHRLGAANVTTVEVDAAVSRAARERLQSVGMRPEMVVGDGFAGYKANAPYHRILATCGLREVSGAWLEQVRRGGLIVVPWGTHYSNADAVVRLVVRDGVASGRFTESVEFMKLRAQRLPFAGHSTYVPGGLDGADRSTTAVTEGEFVTGRFSALPFALGLRVRGCTQAVAEKRDGARPVWFYGLDDRSWACVMFRDGEAEAAVWQSGPRRLWDEVEASYRWWEAQGRPGHDRFGLTVTPEGQRVWLDEPDQSWSLTG